MSGADAGRALSSIVVVINVPAPPPPPLSTVVDHWAPLYFLLGLTAAYAVVMALVVLSFHVKLGGGPPGETQPLQPTVASTFKRPVGAMGKAAWQGADPAMVQQYAMIDGWMRAAFVRKVYAILSTQLLMTVAIVVGLIYAAFVHGDPNYPSHFGHWIAGPGHILTLVIWLFSFCLLCALMSCKNSYPLNFVGLATFTAGMSISLSVICIVYYGSGLGEQLLLAFVITTATFIALTLFTIFSKIDFSYVGHSLNPNGIAR